MVSCPIVLRFGLSVLFDNQIQLIAAWAANGHPSR